MLFAAGLTVLQLGIGSARAVDLCCLPDDCDVGMPCYGIPCISCAPLPALGARLNTLAIYTTELISPELVSEIPEGKLSDIWRPPRADAGASENAINYYLFGETK